MAILRHAVCPLLASACLRIGSEEPPFSSSTRIPFKHKIKKNSKNIDYEENTFCRDGYDKLAGLVENNEKSEPCRQST